MSVTGKGVGVAKARATPHREGNAVGGETSDSERLGSVAECDKTKRRNGGDFPVSAKPPGFRVEEKRAGVSGPSPPEVLRVEMTEAWVRVPDSLDNADLSGTVPVGDVGEAGVKGNRVITR